MLNIQGSKGLPTLSPQEFAAAEAGLRAISIELQSAQQTATVHPIELGWLGAITCRHPASMGAAGAAGTPQLMRCTSCNRAVLAARMAVHASSCTGSSSTAPAPRASAAGGAVQSSGGYLGSGTRSGGGGLAANTGNAGAPYSTMSTQVMIKTIWFLNGAFAARWWWQCHVGSGYIT
jgi:hypothetical protein